MSEWGNAPWTLRAYVVISLAGAALIAVVAPATPVAPRVFLVALAAVVCFFLLRRVRWLWITVIVLDVLGFAPLIIEGGLTWYGAVEGLVALVLLLHPDTRRFFRRDEMAAEA